MLIAIGTSVQKHDDFVFRKQKVDYSNEEKDHGELKEQGKSRDNLGNSPNPRAEVGLNGNKE